MNNRIHSIEPKSHSSVCSSAQTDGPSRAIVAAGWARREFIDFSRAGFAVPQGREVWLLWSGLPLLPGASPTDWSAIWARMKVVVSLCCILTSTNIVCFVGRPHPGWGALMTRPVFSSDSLTVKYTGTEENAGADGSTFTGPAGDVSGIRSPCVNLVNSAMGTSVLAPRLMPLEQYP